MRGNRGFTLIEVIVVAGIIAILAGILVPLIFNQIDEAKKTRALAECKTISTALLMFKKDTGKWPYLDASCSPYFTTLQSSSGILPDSSVNSWNLGDGQEIMFSFILNLPAGTACYNNSTALGYLPQDQADSWDRKYIVNSINFGNNNPVWVISSGPNGCLDTSVNSPNLNDTPCTASPGDDLGVRIK